MVVAHTSQLFYTKTTSEEALKSQVRACSQCVVFGSMRCVVVMRKYYNGGSPHVGVLIFSIGPSS